MVSLSKRALKAFLLVTVGAAFDAIPAVAAEGDDVALDDPYDGGFLERPLEDFYPEDEWSPGDQGVESTAEDQQEVASNVLVTFSDPAGEENIRQYVNEKAAQGKKMRLKNSIKYKSPQPRGNSANAHGGGNGKGSTKGSGGVTSQGGGNGNNKGGNGGNPNKRFLEVNSTDVDIGFAVVETFDGDSVANETMELSGLDGVTSVEYDVELSVADVTSLRGANSANEHVREIVEALTGEGAKLDVEYAPEHEEHGRNLAEETPYGITMVNVTHLWNKPPKASVKICVIDTGYGLGHPDLPDATRVTGWDTGSSSKGVWNVDGHSHGTHCAGTIGAIGSNGAGVVGVNPDPSKFTFHIGKGLSDRGSGSGSDVINAVNDCVANGAKVISMSLGCSNCYRSAYDQAYKDAYDQDVLIIAAAGNTGRDTAHYPSAYRSVVSVASVRETNNGELSYFSTRNDQTEIAGPGHYVKSTVPVNKGSYKTMSGTSMATPHVAGVAALLISHFPDCTNNQIRNAMIHSAREPPNEPKNTPGWDKYYGWGIINAGRAYELLETKGCEGAGGRFPAEGEKLSAMAMGGKDQKSMGCTSDDQCHDGNLCKGEQRCNVGTGMCYTVDGTTPDCDDGVNCTVDTCDPANGQCKHTPMSCEDGNKCNGIYICRESDGTCQLDQLPVDCNDGNACTVDKCITSTGACQHTDLTCNDGNSCTAGDSCNVDTGCVFAAPTPGCCGNAECEAEAGENESTCPIDCSDSIMTSVDTSVARYRFLGSQFNIKAKSKNITVSGVGVHCILPEDKVGKVHVYTLGGDYYGGGNWYRKSRWRKVVEQDVTCAGAGKVTEVALPETVHVGKGLRQAFSIYVLTSDIRSDYPTTRHIYHRAGRHAVYKEDSYVQIHTGSANFCSHGWCAIMSPMAYSGSINYVAVDDHPTASPTLSSMPTTPVPTLSPVEPTISPTKNPSISPTDSPTNSPSTSLVPTEFVPEVVELTKDVSGWANILRSHFFEVTGGAEWAKITNLKIVTYRTNRLKVYMKRGVATSFENAPCAWKLVAETAPEWTGRYWQRMYPPWQDGFDPVVVAPHETVSFYVVNAGTGYGILGRRTGSRYNYYRNAWGALDVSSPVGAMKMGDGRCGERGKLFKPCSKWYGGYGMYGGLKVETMHPDMKSPVPTQAPTEPFSSATIPSPMIADPNHQDFRGVQFDVDNTHDTDITINSFDVHFNSTGEQHVEIWYRAGTHKGGSANCGSGGRKFNNVCKNWRKIVDKKITSAGPGQLTKTPTFTAVAKAGSSASFSIVSSTGFVRSHDATAASPADDGFLRINRATRISDYYGDAVQTSNALDPSEFSFEGAIGYEKVNSKCAILCQERWAVCDTFGGAVAEEGDDPNPEETTTVYEPLAGDGDGPPLDEEPPLDDGGPIDGTPEEDMIMEY